MKDLGPSLSMTVTGQAAAAGNPLVSVIIPCYNYASYLGEAIESALRQTWRPIEIIVVDDGSTDETADIVTKFAQITAISQPNQGPSAARNAGLKACRGRYVVFLDADDLLMPTAVEIGVRELAAHPECAFAWGGFRYIDRAGGRTGPPCIPQISDDAYLALLRFTVYFMFGAILFRRDIFDRVGHFDTSLRAVEDYELCLRVAREFPVRYHGELVTYYRMHNANSSRDAMLMMTSGLEVLARQRPWLRHDRRRRSAYYSGLRNCRRSYGRQVLQDSWVQLGRRNWSAAFDGSIFVLRHAPAVLVKLAARHCARKALVYIRQIFRYSTAAKSPPAAS